MASKYNISAFMRMAHRSSGFCKYGLYRDDMLYETPPVEEALRRLPQPIKDERNYRILRAMHHDMNKIYLPENEWVSLEEDYEKGTYLQPYLEEVLKEIKEQKEWMKK